MASLEIIAKIQSERIVAGLRLEWIIPAIPNTSELRNYVAFAKDETQKQAWLANGDGQGWKRVA